MYPSREISWPRRPEAFIRRGNTAMPTIGANGVGRFSVEFEVAEYEDMARTRPGIVPPAKARRRTVRGVVDPATAKPAGLRDGVNRLSGGPARQCARFPAPSGGVRLP